MESATLAAWILAASTIIGTSVTTFIIVRFRGQDTSAKVLQDALRPVNEALLRHDRNHAEHYATANTVQRIVQQLTDHEKHDDSRFDALLQMQEEIRDDIKKLLARPVIMPTKMEYPQ